MTTQAHLYKPCPFCGGSASLALCGFSTARMVCMGCGSEGQYSPSREEAIAAWNRRTPKDAAPESAPISAEMYSALTCAAFAIRCLRDGVDIGEKLPDTLARIEKLLAAESLEEMVARITPENRHALDFGEDWQVLDLPVKWTGANGESHEISLDYATRIAKWVFDTHGDVPQVDAVLAGGERKLLAAAPSAKEDDRG